MNAFHVKRELLLIFTYNKDKKRKRKRDNLNNCFKISHQVISFDYYNIFLNSCKFDPEVSLLLKLIVHNNPKLFLVGAYQLAFSP